MSEQLISSLCWHTVETGFEQIYRETSLTLVSNVLIGLCVASLLPPLVFDAVTFIMLSYFGIYGDVRCNSIGITVRMNAY